MKRFDILIAIFSILGSTIVINASAEDSDYIYQTIPAGGVWKQCEATRASALQWARADMEREAREDCRQLGKGWSYKEISVEGYQGINPCECGKSFKAFIERASAICKRLR
jgi:hypothetical protein